eukprot:5254202-Ditylum_brightwellii.AAC.1
MREHQMEIYRLEMERMEKQCEQHDDEQDCHHHGLMMMLMMMVSEHDERDNDEDKEECKNNNSKDKSDESMVLQISQGVLFYQGEGFKMSPKTHTKLNEKHGYKMSPKKKNKMQKDIEKNKKEYKDGGEENK